MFTLEVPDDVITLSTADLPGYWNEESYERTEWILRDWLTAPTTLIAAVPSVVVPMSVNYFLHPAHPRFREVQVVKQEPFLIERRLWKEGGE